MTLTQNDRLRYQRQMLYPDFGEAGQDKLKHSWVAVIGLGGLGSAASVCLACAGIGHITIVDHDSVELSNLNRQPLYTDEDIGKKKVLIAAGKLGKLNPSVEVIPVCQRVTKKNIVDIIKGADVVIDGMDNFEDRLILNSASISQRIPFIHGGIWGLDGEMTTIIPGKTACLTCIFPQVPKTEKEIPVFGVTPSLVGSLQAMEAIKLLTGIGDLLTNKMLYFRGATMEFSLVNLTRRPDCKVCGG